MLVVNACTCSYIFGRNHRFDSPSRLNRKQRKSKRSDISKPNAVSRGCLPIRQHHKCDETIKGVANNTSWN